MFLKNWLWDTNLLLCFGTSAFGVARFWWRAALCSAPWEFVKLRPDHVRHAASSGPAGRRWGTGPGTRNQQDGNPLNNECCAEAEREGAMHQRASVSCFHREGPLEEHLWRATEHLNNSGKHLRAVLLAGGLIYTYFICCFGNKRPSSATVYIWGDQAKDEAAVFLLDKPAVSVYVLVASDATVTCSGVIVQF